jgi:hypothetical protein
LEQAPGMAPEHPISVRALIASRDKSSHVCHQSGQGRLRPCPPIHRVVTGEHLNFEVKDGH